MGVTSLTRQELYHYRVKLEALVDRLSDTAARLESEVGRPTGWEGMTSDNPNRDAVSTSTEGEEEVAQSAMLNEEQLLTETRAALTRLDDGTFGRCERCGRTIGKSRLDAVPYSRWCIRCAHAENPKPASEAV